MKAIASGDFHIDINNRFEDTKSVLRQMTVYAIKNNVTETWILGDIYNKSRPYNSEKVLFHQFVKTLTDNSIKVTIISGNHDLDRYKTSAVEEFGVLNLPNVKLLPNPSVIDFNGQKVYLGHFLINGAKLGVLNYSMNHAVNLDGILKTSASLYLLGDIHKPQKLHSNPDVLYVGSPERIDFGERDEIKGFVLITDNMLGNPDLKYEFIPLKIRPMIQLELKSGEKAEKALIDKCTDAVVKARITCTKDQYKKIDESRVRDLLKKAYSLRIEYNILREDKTRNANISESCEPYEAFINYAKAIKLDEKTINVGLEIIKEIK